MTSPRFGLAALRQHDSDSTQLKTPEPPAVHDNMQQPPSPPRPRFKLKRRLASNLSAPTQQFLASVAAADVPIPSIEEPDPAQSAAAAANEPMAVDTTYPVIHQLKDLDHSAVLSARTFSPPKTPIPDTACPLSLEQSQYPDWSIDSPGSDMKSTLDCESSRPSTAVSTQTSASVFSRYSITSDDLRCFDMEFSEAHVSQQNNSKETVADNGEASQSQSHAKLRRAQWTKPMSDHLWSTYLKYLQDPKMTPIRFTKSGIPPQGVCSRVSREARRSWRGANPQGKSAEKSGSNTPTAGAAGTFMQWPHTCASTRAHLRELCKRQTASSGTRASQYLAHSPTPFGRTAARFWNRRTTPTPIFSSRDMTMSLTLSTAESMQPSGPLAQLTQATPGPEEEPQPTATDAPSPTKDVSIIGHQRLASPFAARSYGPSSTEALGASFSLGPQRQTRTVGLRRNLQSPARLTRGRSNTYHTHQKRRSRQSSPEPRRTKRPSLGADFWTQPSTPPLPMAAERPQEKSEPKFSSSSNSEQDQLFVPRTNLAELFSAPLPGPVSKCQPSSHQSLGIPGGPPPRLGSPFSTSSSSLSFPNRFFKAENDLVAEPRPFATVQQSNNNETTTTSAPPRNLTGRLAYIDQRLREFRQRDNTRRRSESPF